MLLGSDLSQPTATSHFAVLSLASFLVLRVFVAYSLLDSLVSDGEVRSLKADHTINSVLICLFVF